MSQEIKLLQYNTHLFLGTALGLAPEYEDELRLQELIKQLKSVDVDIVGLNEVWSDASKMTIINAVRREFPYSYFEPNSDLTKIGSGLLLLSKHVLTRTSYTKFDDLVGFDSMSQKGIYQVIATVKRDEGYTPVFIFITHTQSGSDADETAARASNMTQIRTVIRNAPFGLQPVLLFGDLNVIGETGVGNPTGEYLAMKSTFLSLGLLDLARVLFPNAAKNPLYTYDTVTNNLASHFDNEKVAQRLDYCFANNIGDDPASSSELSVITDWKYADPKTHGFTDVSDHYPIRFSISPGNA